jgi:hypothetical protein
MGRGEPGEFHQITNEWGGALDGSQPGEGGLGCPWAIYI